MREYFKKIITKKLIIILCILIIITIYIANKLYSNAATTAPVPNFVYCNAVNYTYVYKSASSSSTKIGKSYSGYVHRVLGSSGNYYKVYYCNSNKKNVVGYVSKKYFTKVIPRLGIDVSKWQGSINWNKVAHTTANGKKISFAIIRLGYSSTSGTCYLDSKFKTNISSAAKNNLKVGVYFYSKAKTANQAKKEANYVIKQLASYKSSVTMPVAFDYEDASIAKKLTQSQVNSILYAFVNRIKSAGYTSRIYSYENFILKYTNYKNLPCRVWTAKYPSNDTGEKLSYPTINNNNMWQFTQSGKVYGINGYVDMNWDLSHYQK